MRLSREAIGSAMTKGAIEIGDSLIDSALSNEIGHYWETIDSNFDSKLEFSAKEGSYSGTSGIAMYLLQLYRYTKDEKYLNEAESAIQWTVASAMDSHSHNYSFYTGRMSVVQVLLSFYEATGQRWYLDSACKLASGIDSFISNEGALCELLNGISGALIGLLRLHTACGDDSVLNSIRICTEQLLDKAVVTPRGQLFWDRHNMNVAPLCGLSHGNSGIGYAFLELGFFFNNPSFYWIAERAFQYENAHWNRKTKNWRDLRSLYRVNSERYDTDFRNQEFDVFYESQDMAAWCHGAPGIGLSRLRAYELTKKPMYLVDLQRAMMKTKQVTKFMRTATLCHGKAGNASLFIEAYKQTKRPEYLKLAMDVAHDIVLSREKDGFYASGHNISSELQQEDNSLFMGNAGIGYFFLQIVQPDDIPPIAINYGNHQCSRQLSGISKLSVDEIRKRISGNALPRYYQMCKSLGVEPTQDLFDRPRRRKLSLRVPDNVPQTYFRALKEILLMEAAMFSLLHKSKSFLLSYLKVLNNMRSRARLADFDSKDMADEQFALAEECDIVELKSAILIPANEVLLTKLPKSRFVLLVRDSNYEVNEFDLELLYYSMLSSLRKPTNFATLLQNLIKGLDIDDDDRVEFEALVLQQFRLALTSGVVVNCAAGQLIK